MSKYKVIAFSNVDVDFDVELVRGFRVLHKMPKCWDKITNCKTCHGSYESGSTDIYMSKNTKKYYMVRYFDGCFSEMYAEVQGVNWEYLRDEVKKVLVENRVNRKGLDFKEKEERRMALRDLIAKKTLEIIG